jgi:hypothetical protein
LIGILIGNPSAVSTASWKGDKQGQGGDGRCRSFHLHEKMY